jgi:hypothetical protein
VNPEELIAQAVASMFGGEVPAPAPELSKKERKKLVKRKAEWADEVMSRVDPHGLTAVIFVQGKPILNNTAMVARTALLVCGQAAALKSSFAACPCPVCAKVASFPERAILEGYGEWFGEFARGVHDGQDPERLVSAILRKVEPA